LLSDPDFLKNGTVRNGGSLNFAKRVFAGVLKAVLAAAHPG